MASYYEHNFAAFGKECLMAGFMRRAMVARAEAVAATAEAMAPVETGTYKSSFRVTSGITSAYAVGPRAYARVTNTAPHAFFVEYGSRRVKKYRILGKSLHAAGGDVHSGASTDF